MTEDTWLRQQFDFGNVADLMLCEHVSHPNSTAAFSGCSAMIAVVHSCQRPPVAAKERWSLQFSFGVKHHVVHGVSKGVFDRPFPAVIGLTRDMIDGRCHSAAIRTTAR